MNKIAESRKNRKKKVGIVVSDRMDKTVVVRVERLTRHPLYGRTIKSHSKFKVHDEQNQAKVGDKVLILETRPLSKEKCWRIGEVLK